MRGTLCSRPRFALLLAACLLGAVACSSAAPDPGPDSPTGSQAEALARGGPDPRDPRDPPDPPVQPPPTCRDDPGCRLTYFAPTDQYEEAVREAAHCGPVYQYYNGAGAGFLGGLGSFCPDTPANRALLRANNVGGFDASYCDQCLKIPAGSLFAFWSAFEGPGCPTGCVVGKQPSPF